MSIEYEIDKDIPETSFTSILSGESECVTYKPVMSSDDFVFLNPSIDYADADRDTIIIDDVEYPLSVHGGEYPQFLVGADKQSTIEKAFHRKELKKTGKEYSVLTPQMNVKKYKEYEYDGHKFVRVTPETNGYDDGKMYPAHKPIWFEVGQITWLFYMAERSLCSELALFPGRPENVSEEEWNSKFNDWFCNRFLKEISPEGMTADDTKEKAPVISKRRGYGVTVDETPMSIKEQIAFYIENGQTFMLRGPSGCGKTRRIQEIDPDFVAVPLSKGCDPDAIVGKVCYSNGAELSPVDENGEWVSLPPKGTWVAPDWYNDICAKCAAEPDKKHIVFIDEVTNVSEHYQSLLFHLLGGNRSITASKGVLPKNATIVLAGNGTEDSGAAYNPTEPMWRRMYAIIDVKPNIPDWLEWGSQKSTTHPEEEGRLNIHPLVSAFVATYGEDCFYTPFDEENPTQVMDPRGWAQVSDIIYDNKGVIKSKLMANKMGKYLMSTFLEFAKDEKRPITADEVLFLTNEEINSGKIGLPIPQQVDQKLALVYGLRNVEERNVGKVRNFIQRYLKHEMKAVFDQIWCEGKSERVLYLKRLDGKMSGSTSTGR